MPTRGALMVDDDGSVYFVPEDVLEECRLTDEELEAIKQDLTVPEVEGFVDPSLVRMWSGFDVGRAIGAGVAGLQNDTEAAARENQKQWGMADLAVERNTFLRTSRRRL